MTLPRTGDLGIFVRYYPCFVSNTVKAIVPDENKLSVEYLAGVLSNVQIQSRGTVQQNRANSDILSLDIPQPDKQAHESFVQAARPLLQLAEVCAFEIRDLEDLKRTWLQAFDVEKLAKTCHS